MAGAGGGRRHRAGQRLRPVHRPVEARRASKTGEKNSIVTSFNRNFPARNDGNAETLAFIGSPEIVMALRARRAALVQPADATRSRAPDGKQFRLDAARDGAGAARRTASCATRRATWRPPEDGAGVAVDGGARQRAAAAARAVRRLGRQGLRRSCRSCSRRRASARPTTSRRPGRGSASAATSTGSATTCSSARSTPSPARPGTGLNLLTGETEQPLPAIARAYKAQGLRWVVVGDENYGEGSSREHAAMSPRFLGAARRHRAVSFARIHESNLKKQGILPLTFAEPGRLRQGAGDRQVSLLGLAHLAPGTPVTAMLHHEDGSDGGDPAPAHAERRADRLVQGRVGAEPAAGEVPVIAIRPWPGRTTRSPGVVVAPGLCASPASGRGRRPIGRGRERPTGNRQTFSKH